MTTCLSLLNHCISIPFIPHIYCCWLSSPYLPVVLSAVLKYFMLIYIYFSSVVFGCWIFSPPFCKEEEKITDFSLLLTKKWVSDMNKLCTFDCDQAEPWVGDAYSSPELFSLQFTTLLCWWVSVLSSCFSRSSALLLPCSVCHSPTQISLLLSVVLRHVGPANSSGC